MTHQKHLFPKAALLAVWNEAVIADQSRKESARVAGAPVFPAKWGEPCGKHWLVVRAGKEVALPNRPLDEAHLTVWRFANFEATATFDTWSIYGDARSALFVQFQSVQPVGEGWQGAGETSDQSTLWRRPLVQEVGNG